MSNWDAGCRGTPAGYGYSGTGIRGQRILANPVVMGYRAIVLGELPKTATGTITLAPIVDAIKELSMPHRVVSLPP